jgi:hypothetical protein
MKQNRFNYLLACIFFIFPIISKAIKPDSIVLKLNVSDCQFCYTGFSYFGSLKEVKKTLVIRKNDRSIVLKRWGNIINENNFIIIESDSNFDSISTCCMSEIIAYNQSYVVYKDVFKHFIGEFSSPTRIDTLITIPDTIALSEFTYPTINNDFVVLTDVIQNAVVIFNIKTNIIHTIDFNKFDFKPTIQKSSLLDTVSLKMYDPILKQLQAFGTSKVEISPPFINTDNLYFLAKLILPEINAKDSNNFIIRKRNIIMSYNLSSNSLKTEYFEKTFNEVESTNYDFYKSAPIIDSCFLYLISYNQNYPDSNYVCKISYCKSNNADTLLRNPNILPNIYSNTNVEYNFSTPIVHFPIFMFPLSETVYNMKLSGRSFNLPFNNKNLTLIDKSSGKYKFDYYLRDFYHINDTLYTIHYNSFLSTCIISQSSLDKGTTTKIKVLSVPEFISLVSLKFEDQSRMICISKNRRKILSIKYEL